MSHGDELFDVVDEKDHVVGQAKRSECHGNPTLIHRVAHVLLFNGSGELLLQKRGVHKDVQPGKWDTSVGGHLDPGESYLAAAKREMWEELGVAGVPLTFLYHSRIRNDYESENVASYLCLFNGDISFAREEIEEVRFWSCGEIETCLGQGLFTPNFEEEWEMFKGFQRKYSSREEGNIGLGEGGRYPDLIRGLISEGGG